jgi:hypothetical protein
MLGARLARQNPRDGRLADPQGCGQRLLSRVATSKDRLDAVGEGLFLRIQDGPDRFVFV